MKRNLFILILLMANTVIFAQNYFSGTILYHNNPEYPIPEVQVDLYDLDGNFVAGTTTNNEGVYVFDNLADGSYNLELSTTLPGEQITMQDALSILFYMNGLIDYTPIQYLAMDVTNNGVVNFSDFLFIVVQHFVFNQPFPAGDWVFETATITTGQRDGAGNLGGSRTGDAEGILVPTGRDLAQQIVPIATDDLNVSTFTELDIPVYAELESQSIDAYGLVLGYDPSLFSIISVTPSVTDANSNVGNNEIRMSWVGLSNQVNLFDDGLLATVRVRILDNGVLDHVFPFEIKNESHVVVNGQLKQSTYGMPTISMNDFSFNLFPNPAHNRAQLSFTMPETGVLQYQLVAATGQQVQSKEFSFSAGPASIQISVDELNTGIYQILLIDSASGKVLLQKKLLVQ